MDKISMHYFDILRKVERVIDSCQTTDQLASAWRYADFYEEYCKRIGVKEQTRMVVRSNINNRLEDRWEEVRLKQLNQYGDADTAN